MILLKAESLIVKLSVSILDGKGDNNVYRVFSTDAADYMTIEPYFYIALQYKPSSQREQPWNSSMVCHINYFNITSLRRELSTFLEEYSKPNTFIYYTSGRVEISEYGKSLSRTFMLKGSDSIMLEPKVLVDQKSGDLLPGVELCVNFKDYAASLSVDEFEALVEILNTINMRQEAMQIINTTLLASLTDGKKYIKELTPKDDKSTASVKVPVGKSIFERPPKETVEETVDRLVKDARVTSLDDL